LLNKEELESTMNVTKKGFIKIFYKIFEALQYL